MEEYFILDEVGEPKREFDLDTWMRWYEQADRGIARTPVTPQVTVLTTFLGMHEAEPGVHDAAQPEPAPRLFETRVFGGVLDGEEVATPTRAEAVAAHTSIAEWCRIGNSADAGVSSEALI